VPYKDLEKRRQAVRESAARARLDPEKNEKMKEQKRRSARLCRAKDVEAARAHDQEYYREVRKLDPVAVEKQHERSRARSKTSKEKERCRQKQAEARKDPEYVANSATYAKVHQKERRLVDVGFRLSQNLRTRLGKAVKEGWKAGSAVKDLGCTIEELKAYLEAKFEPGMDWDNWGRYGWHIDHIRPLASFDLTDREQFLRACHYTNLQPLWAEDNLKKSDHVL